jgi:putative ABC transport system permease protein
MHRLNLKLLRDLRASRWQFLAISFVAALGVALFYGFVLVYLNQKASYQRSYALLAFADVTVTLRRAPRFLVAQIARLPGVIAVEGRIVRDVEVEQIGGRRPRVIGRMITVPPRRELTVNRFLLIEGRPLSDTPRREVLLEASFARANRYRPGDRLYIRFGGRRVAFIVAGIITSPEYIYPVASEQFCSCRRSRSNRSSA